MEWAYSVRSLTTPRICSRSFSSWERLHGHRSENSAHRFGSLQELQVSARFSTKDVRPLHRATGFLGSISSNNRCRDERLFESNRDWAVWVRCRLRLRRREHHRHSEPAGCERVRWLGAEFLERFDGVDAFRDFAIESVGIGLK